MAKIFTTLREAQRRQASLLARLPASRTTSHLAASLRASRRSASVSHRLANAAGLKLSNYRRRGQAKGRRLGRRRRRRRPKSFADKEGTTDQPRRVELEALATITDSGAVLAVMLCILIQRCFS